MSSGAEISVREPMGHRAPLLDLRQDQDGQFISIPISSSVKPVCFLGGSLDEVRSFPGGTRREVGFQIDRLPRGLDPFDWKPMTSIGPGVREIRVREASCAYRVIHVATLGDAVYVLHAFQKKAQATSKRDLDLAVMRY
jgi:phage-related protein